MKPASSTQDAVTVRQARLADLDSVAALFDAYRQFYEQPADLALATVFIGERLRQGESTVLLAETAEGPPAGFCQLYPSFCSVAAARIHVLYDLFVAPHARGQGTGRALMRAAQDFAAAAGSVRMDLTTARDNHRAQALCEATGWRVDTVFLAYNWAPANGPLPIRFHMLLYGCTNSGHSFKVRSFLLLAGLAHEYRWINVSKPRVERPQDFMAASKFGEVPVLLDEGQTLCQSNAILIYLAQKSRFFAGQPGEWQAILEWLSWETNRIGFSVPNLRYALLWAKQPPEVLAYLRTRAEVDLGTLECFLSSSEYLLPSGPTIADISCSAYLFWLAQAGLSAADYPNVERWLTALSALPRWRHPDKALQAEPLGR